MRFRHKENCPGFNFLGFCIGLFVFCFLFIVTGSEVIRCVLLLKKHHC